MTDPMIAPGEGVAQARPFHVGAECSPLFLRRKDASRYLLAQYGFGAVATLAKLATIGGGPIYRLIGRMPVYLKADLDAWALAKLGPAQKSTSDSRSA
jgi:hypothetical protein